jgi:hypothetical protein
MPLAAHYFDSLEAVLAHFRKDSPRPNLFKYSPQNNFEWVAGSDDSKGRQAYRPAELLSSPYLYRGQYKRHHTCQPTVFRGFRRVSHPKNLPASTRAWLLLHRVRLEEFCVALKEHPACIHAADVGLEVHPHALAQHYELLTDRLDFTQDPLVAAFFASNRKDSSGRWQPLDGEAEDGVIYRLKIHPLSGYLSPSKIWPLECIGNQALPRPAEQRGWTIQMALGACLEECPVDVFSFHRNIKESRNINTLFDGGRKLFPDDVMSEIAQTISRAVSIPRSLLSNVLTSYGCPNELIDAEIKVLSQLLAKKFAVHVDERDEVALTAEQVLRARASVEIAKNRFLAGVRPVRHLSKEEMDYFHQHGRLKGAPFG